MPSYPITLSGSPGDAVYLDPTGSLPGLYAANLVGIASLALGAVVSGNVASGAVMGSLGGGPFNIASGTIGPNDLGFTPSATGATTWVDSINGNDSTGTRGRLDHPFLTISAAITASSSGDVIRVLPGTYNEALTMKDGVSVIGFDPVNCILSRNVAVGETTVTMGNNMVFTNFTLNLTAQASTTITGVVSNSTAFLDHITLSGSFAGLFGVVNAISITGGTLTINNSTITAAGLGTAPVGVSITGGSLVTHNSIIDARTGNGIGVSVANTAASVIFYTTRVRGNQGLVSTGFGGTITADKASTFTTISGGPGFLERTDGQLTIGADKLATQNFPVTAAPTATDDAQKGYLGGSQWVMSGGGAWVATSTVSGNAKWAQYAGSGTTVTNARYVIDDYSASGIPLTTEELISGFVAVSISQSGHLRVAMPSVSGRMPAVGVAVSGALSGQTASYWTEGFFQVAAVSGGPGAAFSGQTGQPLFIARSGQIGLASGGFLSGGFSSGDIQQTIGEVVNSGGIKVRVGPVLQKAAPWSMPATFWISSGDISSGQIGQFHIASGAINSGNIASGALAGSLGGGAFNIASGTIGPNDLGSGSVLSGAIASGQIGQFALASGAVGSGVVASGAVQGSLGTGADNIASGTIGPNDIGSGAVGSGQVASGAVKGAYNGGSPVTGSINIASGTIGSTDIGNAAILGANITAGTITASLLGAGAVTSGAIASGSVGTFHLASGGIILSGTIGSGGVKGSLGGGAFVIASGTIGPNDLGSGSILSGAIASGQIGTFHLGSGGIIRSGSVGSGAVAGQRGGGAFGIASGTLGHNDFGSGAIQSGDIASGVIGTFHLGSGGVIRSGNIGSGAVAGSLGGGAFGIASGTIGPNDLGSGAILSGAIASGQVGQFALASGSVVSGTLGVAGTPNGTKVLRDDFTWTTLASGFVPSYTSGAVLSGTIASGQIGTFHFASGDIVTYSRNQIVDFLVANEAISGVVAVALDSGGSNVVRAQPGSGFRMPAIGVSITNVASGGTAQFITHGFLAVSTSGAIGGSGFTGLNARAYVGSGGLLLCKSGFVTGASSGGGPGVAGTSGRIVQRIGVFVSGGVLVNVDNYMTSGLLTLGGIAQ